MPGLKLPSAYPDELIVSVLIRGAIHTGLPPKRLLIRTLGRERSHLSMFIPTDLCRLAEAMNKDPKRVLWEHTSFPYAVAFMSSKQVAWQEAKLLEARDAGSVSLGAFARSAAQGLAGLRFCRDCAREDITAFGESYWHRTHCLPAVHGCIKHNAPLHCCQRAQRTLSQQLLLPLPDHFSSYGDSLGATSGGMESKSSMTSPNAHLEETSCPQGLKLKLAAAAAELLSPSWKHQSDWASRYRTDALQQRYRLSIRAVATARLAHDLKLLYGAAYLQELKCDFEGYGQAWPGAMVRSAANATFSPVKHLLLKNLLDYAPKEVQTAAFGYRAPGKKVRDYEAVDVALAAKVHEETNRLLLLQQVTTTQAMLRDLGHWEMFRHAREKLPRTEAAIQRFKCSDASARRTGGRAVHANRLKAVAEGRQKAPKSWAERAYRR